METKNSKKFVYAVYKSASPFGSIFKSLKSVCFFNDDCFSIHSLYKHDFEKGFYHKGEFTIIKQRVF